VQVAKKGQRQWPTQARTLWAPACSIQISAHAATWSTFYQPAPKGPRHECCSGCRRACVDATVAYVALILLTRSQIPGAFLTIVMPTPACCLGACLARLCQITPCRTTFTPCHACCTGASSAGPCQGFYHAAATLHSADAHVHASWHARCGTCVQGTLSSAVKLLWETTTVVTSCAPSHKYSPRLLRLEAWPDRTWSIHQHIAHACHSGTAQPHAAARHCRRITAHAHTHTTHAGSVKGLTPQQLQDLDCHVILGNTYHLENRPGSDLVRVTS
jgi:hypothetical protein